MVGRRCGHKDCQTDRISSYLYARTRDVAFRLETIQYHDERHGEAVIIDFGLSKQYDESGEPESSTKVGAGTPGYAPIEQANYREGKDFPVTMDIYALGGTMFKMLTGRRTPEASDILNDGFPTYELYKRGIQNNLIAIISKAMSPTQKERYQTIAEFIDSFNIDNNQQPAEVLIKYDMNFWGIRQYELTITPNEMYLSMSSNKSKVVKCRLSSDLWSSFLKEISEAISKKNEERTYRDDTPTSFEIILYGQNKERINHLYADGWGKSNIQGSPESWRRIIHRGTATKLSRQGVLRR